jgi:hypothetical protein
MRALQPCGKSDMQAALPHERLIQISGASIQARNCPQVWRPQRADARRRERGGQGSRKPESGNPAKGLGWSLVIISLAWRINTLFKRLRDCTLSFRHRVNVRPPDFKLTLTATP